MPSFIQRSYKKELLDGDYIPFAEIKRNMQELNFINRYLGGHAITLKGLSSILDRRQDQQPLSVVEIGCGGGDNLQAIKIWAKHKKQPLRLTGIDINEECLAYARSKSNNKDIAFYHTDYREAAFTTKPDIIFSSLFCHHFTDQELIAQLQWLHANSRLGFFINDLHRHPLAWLSIKALTKLFSKSRLVKHDAPLSVLRGFVRNDWHRLFAAAKINAFGCSWQWAFRWLVTYRHDANA